MPSVPPRRRASFLVVTLAAALLGFVGCRVWQGQSAAAAPARTNHLAGATSPYLLEHAHNPVDWYPWGPEALEKAKREGKPIFLSVGYAACHWCHVMARECFEDEGIAKQLNDGFVCIKVDREERPDLDELYMTAVQLLTGSGGWPMSVFLTPEGRPFFGGTYFPRDSFAELLRKVHEVWGDPKKQPEVRAAADRLTRAIGEAGALAAVGGTLAPEVTGQAVRSYLGELDTVNGGFGGRPKFPPSLRLLVMLDEARRQPTPELKRALTLTLDRMARGGMYDQIGGGFHRYSVDEKWLVPHFEKMLYDNALLATVYLEASRTLKNPGYRRIGVETLDFVLRELRDPAGGFHSSLDADSPGPNGEREEGRFYLWTPAEVNAVLGPTDGALFCRIFGVTPAGNFESRNIPNLLPEPVEAWAKKLKTPPAALWKRLDGMRTRLRAARQKRPRPALDDKVLTSWNGLMLRALAVGYDVSGAARYRQAAEAQAAFLLAAMHRDGRLLHAYRGGKTQPQSFLEDYGDLLVGLLELHRVTGGERWLNESRALAKEMLTRFWDEKRGTLTSLPGDHETLVARLDAPEDNATPSGQSMAALALVRLGKLTGARELRERGTALLTHYAGSMKRTPAAAAGMLLAAQAHFAPAAVPVGAGGTPPGALLPAQKEKVTAALEGAPPTVKAGDTFVLRVKLTIAAGWHVNSDRPKNPALIQTRVGAAPGPFEIVSVNYPTATTVTMGKEKLEAFVGEPVLHVRLKALPGADSAEEIRLTLQYQTCNDRVCLRPTETLLRAPLQPSNRSTPK
jgi:uncharacterized protein YyaL (SSP411 family)